MFNKQTTTIASVAAMLFVTTTAYGQDEVWNSVVTEVGEPAISLVTTLFGIVALTMLMVVGIRMYMSGQFDLNHFARMIIIAFAVIIGGAVIGEVVIPTLQENNAVVSGGSGSGLPDLPNIP